MCNPAALAVISAVSTGASVVAQQQQVNAQNRANRQQADNARTAMVDNLDQTMLARDEQQQAAGQRIEQINRDQAHAVATARVSAAGAGVSGLSVQALLADLAGQASANRSAVQTNFENQQRAGQIDRRNVATSARNTIAGLRSPTSPDYLGAALRIGNTIHDYRTNTGGSP